MDFGTQIFELIIHALVVACVAWTVTHETIFEEWRDYARQRCTDCQTLLERKFFYVFTCHYCFSHWVAILLLVITRFKLFFTDWRGYLVALFTIVWLANQLMNLHARLSVGVQHERVLIKEVEEQLDNNDEQPPVAKGIAAKSR